MCASSSSVEYPSIDVPQSSHVSCVLPSSRILAGIHSIRTRWPCLRALVGTDNVLLTVDFASETTAALEKSKSAVRTARSLDASRSRVRVCRRVASSPELGTWSKTEFGQENGYCTCQVGQYFGNSRLCHLILKDLK